MSMASRIAVMAEGRIVQLGTPQEIYESPANRFVADFIGAVNLFAGRVTGVADGLLHIECGEARARFALAHAPLAAGSDVAVVVRPEKLALAAPADAPNHLAGRVRSVAYRGEVSTYEVELAGGKIVRVTLPNVTREHRRVAVGEPVTLAFAPASAVVLPG